MMPGDRRTIKKAPLEQGKLVLLYLYGQTLAGSIFGAFFGEKRIIKIVIQCMRPPPNSVKNPLLRTLDQQKPAIGSDSSQQVGRHAVILAAAGEERLPSV